MRTPDEIRERLTAWEEATAQFSPGASVRRTLGWVPAELRWVLGDEKVGALRQVLWRCLLSELHDAECTMRNAGSDLLLEGNGRPADPSYGHTFRFWLRLAHGQFKDERQSPGPIRKIWILYAEPTEEGFAFTAQDNTLSGTIKFSGDEFEFRMWDHVATSPKK